ncbi:MAG TPA: glycerol-3-phosphate 1-O-acyltransferase PlsY [Thermoanaerobacterales bacterium]|nr:glycerol-3-phosphate 1-O-acyltransferase PlsY [Thermoanaerobacterales bacterium]
MILNILRILASYLLGSISFSYIAGVLCKGIDIRNFGSGNAGTTNVLRVLGPAPAVAVLLCDVFKGVASIYLGKASGSEIIMLLCGIAVVVGHNYPVFLRFKGGKGIATSLGVILTISPLWSSILILIGLVVLYKTRIVSLSVMVGTVLFPFMFVLVHRTWYHLIFALILTCLALYRHKSNLARILSGEEPKLGERESRIK